MDRLSARGNVDYTDALKLLFLECRQYIEDTYPDISKIIGYSDNLLCDYEDYIKMGFTFNGIGEVDYFYYEKSTDKSHTRSIENKVQKLPGESRSDAMNRAGFYKVYDCAKQIWTFNI